MTTLDRYTCDDVLRRLDDFLDRELSPEERRRVEEHLQFCSACAQEYGFEESFLAELRRKVERIDAPPGLGERLFRFLGAAAKPDRN